MDSVTLDPHRAPHHTILLGTLPRTLIPDAPLFDTLWALHPEEQHIIHIHGRKVATPRWQQAYGVDYHYTGTTNRSLPFTAEMLPLLSWCQGEIDPRLNGLLFNWYDGALGHYIGAHRDSDVRRVVGSPIVTLSFGETRTFRMRPHQGSGMVDIPVAHGSVLVIPWQTNRAFTHEVPASKRATGRRISVTARAFEGDSERGS